MNRNRICYHDTEDNESPENGFLFAMHLSIVRIFLCRIKKIECLDSLVKLDVLDLHGNHITRVENLNHLTELRVLNLAGNLIVEVDNLMGMDALTELNLRRNRIRTVAS